MSVFRLLFQLCSSCFIFAINKYYRKKIQTLHEHIHTTLYRHVLYCTSRPCLLSSLGKLFNYSLTLVDRERGKQFILCRPRIATKKAKTKKTVSIFFIRNIEWLSRDTLKFEFSRFKFNNRAWWVYGWSWEKVYYEGGHTVATTPCLMDRPSIYCMYKRMCTHQRTSTFHLLGYKARIPKMTTLNNLERSKQHKIGQFAIIKKIAACRFYCDPLRKLNFICSKSLKRLIVSDTELSEKRYYPPFKFLLISETSWSGSWT